MAGRVNTAQTRHETVDPGKSCPSAALSSVLFRLQTPMPASFQECGWMAYVKMSSSSMTSCSDLH